jgi:hypothetical protein
VSFLNTNFIKKLDEVPFFRSVEIIRKLELEYFAKLKKNCKFLNLGNFNFVTLSLFVGFSLMSKNMQVLLLLLTMVLQKSCTSPRTHPSYHVLINFFLSDDRKLSVLHLNN